MVLLPPAASPSVLLLQQPLQQHHAAIYFGLSCALAALQNPTSSTAWDGLRISNQCRRGCSRVSQGITTSWQLLLGLFIAEKLAESELQVEELRRRRAEDAKANEKVVGIFAAHRQRWLEERKSLRQQFQALVAETRALRSRHEEAASELRRQLEEARRAVGLKEEALELEVQKQEELEERLGVAERASAELRERARKEAQEHSAELWRHKTAYAELVSGHRQLEAELARSARQADAAKEEAKEAVERKGEAVAMVEELSVEMGRLQREAEQRDRILSAMLRKSRVEVEERQMLVREVKMAKARKKQAELETERWRTMWAEWRPSRKSKSSSSRSSRYNNNTSSSSSYDHYACAGDKPVAEALLDPKAKIVFVDRVVEGEEEEEEERVGRWERADSSNVECIDRFPSHVNDRPVTTAADEYQHMQEWYQMENDKHAAMIKQRHNAEVEAFIEQLRVKDEKLETLRWRLVSIDVESARLRCRNEELEGSLSCYRQQNTELERLILDKERESRSLKEQLVSFHAHHQCQRINSTSDDTCADEDACEPHSPRSQVKILRTKSSRRGEECDHIRQPGEEEEEEVRKKMVANAELRSQESRDFMYYNNRAFDVELTSSSSQVSAAADTSAGPVEEEQPVDEAEAMAQETSDEDVATIAHKAEGTGDERVKGMEPLHVDVQRNRSQEGAGGRHNTSSPWKMDIHALAVSYKIKRLKQQLLALENLQTTAAAAAAAKLPSSKEGASSRQQPRSYQMMLSFLNKQVKRYQSLEENIDDLCRRMDECERTAGGGGGGGGREQQNGSALGQFLEETFQVQRYMVATGQKLVEMQPKLLMASSRCEQGGVDMERFVEIVRRLLREIQRGLEVRIARLIGDLEGTLTCHGILQS